MCRGCAKRLGMSAPMIARVRNPFRVYCGRKVVTKKTPSSVRFQKTASKTVAINGRGS